jgi:serine/threonine protein kinase
MFIVQGLIGVGGFGEVLAATLQQTGKWYALKVVNKVNPRSLILNSDCPLHVIKGTYHSFYRVTS